MMKNIFITIILCVCLVCADKCLVIDGNDLKPSSEEHCRIGKHITKIDHIPAKGIIRCTGKRDCGQGPCFTRSYFQPQQSGEWTAPNGCFKVSADMNCNTNSCGVAHVNSVTISDSFSAGISVNFKGAISANAGFTWTNAATTGNTYTYNLQRGDNGHIEFCPYETYVQGQCWTADNCGNKDPKRSCAGYSPNKLSTGEADGFYRFVSN